MRQESAPVSASSSAERPVALAEGLLWKPLLVIGTAAFAAGIPFFFYGTPSGHDVEFHLYSWLDVLTQWKQGVFYPRWAALAHFGYGEPRFLFYPPASWTLGAALSTIFPWTLAASIYLWIVLVAAGASMFMLARRWLDRRNAMFAAALYAVNPYHLVIVYWRSAFAELLSSCLLPLLLLLVLRAAEGKRQAMVPLAFLLAAAWLTNMPAALMIHYSFALLIFLLAWRYHSPRLLVVGAAAVALGAGLAAFYLFPAIYEQKWINIAEAVSAGARPQDNFLFVHTTDADHDAFNRIVSWVAVAEILAILAVAWADRRRLEGQRELWGVLVGWAAACSVLMFSVSGVAWRFLPKLQFMQFPWRWLLCLSMLLSLFIALGLRSWWARGIVCLAMLLVIAVGWQKAQAPWWDTTGDLREMQDNIETGAGYEGTDEYTPVGADPSVVDKDARRVTVDGAAHAAIHVLEWGAERKLFTAEMSVPSRLALRLFNYPAWRVEVNGRQCQVETQELTGQMVVPVEAGANRVEITFTRTWDRAAGGWISVMALVMTLAWRHRSRRSSGVLAT